MSSGLGRPIIGMLLAAFLLVNTVVAQDQPPIKLPEGMELPPGFELPEGMDKDRPGETESPEEIKKREQAEKQRKEAEIIRRYRTLLLKKPFHQWAFDKLFRIYVEKNRLKELVAEYAELSEINPDEDSYHVVLARLYEKTDKPDEAAKALSRIKKETYEVLMLSGRIFRKQKKFPEAVAALEKAAEGIQAGRILKKVYRELGIIYIASGDRKKACDSWGRIKALAPGNYYNIKKLAELYKQNLFYDEALAEYEILIKLASGESARLAEIYSNMGEIYERKTEPEKALSWYEKGIALMARGNWLRAELENRVIRLYQKSNRLPDLEKKALEWLEKNKHDPGAYEMLAAIYVAGGKAAEAAKTLRKATGLFPADMVLSEKLRKTLKTSGETGALITEYRRIISENPQKADLYIELGKVLASDKRFSEAKGAWERALGKHTKDPAFAARLADLYARYKLNTEAVLMYERAIELAPKERSYFSALGKLYFSMQESDKALAAWKRMTTPDPSDPAAWADLSEILKAYGFYDDALSAIGKALELPPRNYKYLFDKAGILVLMKKLKEAAVIYREVASAAGEDYYRNESIAMVVDIAQRRKKMRALYKEESTKTDDISRRIAGLACERLTNYVEAGKIYSAIIEKDPKDKATIEALARVYVRMQCYREAEGTYERLILLNPGKARSYYRSLLDIMILLGEEKKAAAIVDRMMDANPTNPDVYKEAGRAFLSLDRPREACDAYRQATRLKGDDARYWVLLAETLVRLEKDEEAAEVLKKAEKIAKDNRKRFNIIGRIYDIYARLGKIEEELEKLRRRLDDNPYDTGAYIFLAEMLSSNMEYAEAIDLVAHVLEITKEDPMLHELLARLYEKMEEPAAAAEEYEKALDLPNADRKHLLECMGRAFITAGDKETAAETFRKITDTKRAATLLLQNNLYDEAIKTLDAALEKTPGKDAFLNLLAGAYKAKGRKKKAVETYLLAIEAKPANIEYLSTLAELYYEIGEKDKAAEYAGKMFGAALRKDEEDEDEDEEEDEDYLYGYSWRYYGYYSGGSTTGLDPLRSVFYFFIYRGMKKEFEACFKKELENQPENMMLRITAIEMLEDTAGMEDLVLGLLREVLHAKIDKNNLPAEYAVKGDLKDKMRFRLAEIYTKRHALRAKEKARLEAEREKGVKTAEPLLELAMIYDIEKKHDKSLAVVAEVVKLAPDIPIAVLAKGRMHQTRSEWDKAKESYGKYLAILDRKARDLEKWRSYLRRKVINEIPAELRNSVRPEVITFLVNSKIAEIMEKSREEYYWYSRTNSLPGRREILLELAKIEKSAGNMDGAKTWLKKMEPENEKSPYSAVVTAKAYKDFDLEDDEARMYELELARKRYKKDLLGTLSGRIGYSWRYEYAVQEAASSVITYYRKKSRHMDALDLALEYNMDVKPLLAEYDLFEPGVKMYTDRIAAWEKKPEKERREKEVREAVVRLARMYSELKKYDLMETLYKSFLAKYPEDADFLSAYSTLLENREEYKEAGDAMEKAAENLKKEEDNLKRRPRIQEVKKSPPVPPLKENRDQGYYGGRYSRWGRWGGGYSRSSSSSASSTDCLLSLARIRAKTGDKKKAAEALKKYYVRCKKAGQWRGYGSLEQFISRFGLDDEMVPVYRTAMILYPDDNETRMMYGKYLEKKGRFEEAVKVYEKILHAKRQQHGWYYYNQGEGLTERLDRLYHKLGKSGITPEKLLKDAEDNPKNVKANICLAVYYFINGRIRDAAGQVEKTLVNAPYNAKLHRLQFHICRMLGNESEAMRHIEAEIKLADNESEKRNLYTACGAILYFSGREKKAFETWEKMAVSGDSQSFEYLGNLYLNLGMYKKSSEYFQKAADQSGVYSRWSGSETSLKAIGARVLAGDFDNAIKYYLEQLGTGKLQEGYYSAGLSIIAGCAKRIGKLERFEEMLNKKAGENPDKIEWLNLLIQYYQPKNDNNEKMKELYGRMRKLLPKSTGPLTALQSMALDEEDYKLALELAEQIRNVSKIESGSAFTGSERSADFLKQIEKAYHTSRGNIFMKMKKQDDALKEFMCVIEEDKPETYLELAYLFRQYDLDNRVLETMEKFLEKTKAPTSENYSMYAQMLDGVLRLDESAAAWENAAKLSAEGYSRTSYYNSIRTIYKRLGKLSAFIKKMEKIVSEQKGENELEELLLRTYHAIDDEESAEKFIRKKHEQEPLSRQCMSQLTEYLQEHDKYDEAIEVIEKYLDKKPPNPEWIYMNLAEIYFIKLDNENAFKYVKKSCEHDDEPEIAYAGRLMARGFTKEAWEILAPMWKERVDDPGYNMLAAKAAFNLKNWAIAAEAIKRVYKIEDWGELSGNMKVVLRLLISKDETKEILSEPAPSEGGGPAPGETEDVETLKRRYMTGLAQNQDAEAFELAGKILEKEPFNKNITGARMVLARRLGKNDAVIESATHLAKIMENRGGYINRKLAKDFLLSHAKRKDPLSVISDDNITYSEADYNEFIGDLFFEKGDIETADTWWKKILYSSRGYGYYYYGGNTERLAAIYRKHRLFDKAKDLEKFGNVFESSYYYQEEPEDLKEAHRLLELDEKKYDEAIIKYVAYYEKKYKDEYKRPDSYEYNYWRRSRRFSYGSSLLGEFITLLRDQGRLREFFEISRRKIKDRNSSKFYIMLFEALIKELREKGMEKELLAAKHAEKPDSTKAQEEYLDFYWKKKNYEKALPLIKKKLARYPKERSSTLMQLYACASRLEMNDEKENALNEYLHWNTVKPDTNDYWEPLFRLCMEHEMFNSALVWANKLIGKDGENRKKWIKEYAEWKEKHPDKYKDLTEEEIAKKEKGARNGIERRTYRISMSKLFAKLYEKLGLKKEKEKLEADVEKSKYVEPDNWLEKMKKKMKEDNPFDPAPCFRLFSYFWNKGEIDNAFEFLQQGGELSRKEKWFFESSGSYRLFKGDDKKAIDYFLKAQALENAFEIFPEDLRISMGSWEGGYEYQYWGGRSRYSGRYASYGRYSGYGGYSRYGGYSSYGGYSPYYYSRSYGRRTYWGDDSNENYGYNLTTGYAMALAYWGAGDMENAKKYFKTARRADSDSIFRLFADYILDNRNMDWKLVEKVIGEKHFKFFERFKKLDKAK